MKKISGTVPLVLFLLLFLFTVKNSFLNEKNNKAQSAHFSSVQFQSFEHSSQASNNNTNPINFNICINLNETIKTKKRKWAKNNYENWDIWIRNGYSLNEVTIAIEQLAGPNFASSFRSNYLKKNSRLTNENSVLKKMVNELFPELAKHGISAQRLVPNKELLSFKELNDTDKAEFLNSVDITIDDLAYFILDTSIRDEDILLMLSFIENLEEVIGFQELESVSILDYAAYAGRKKVVETLINLGLIPTHDEYLGSTMEWALANLYYNFNNEHQNSAAETVVLLNHLGAKARFLVKNEQFVEGSFPRNYFKFDSSMLEALLADFGLDLTSIQEYKYLSEDVATSLIQELDFQWKYLVAIELNVSSIEAMEQDCELLIKNLYKQWNPATNDAVTKKVIEETIDSENNITKNLHLVDPSLADYIIEKSALKLKRTFLDEKLNNDLKNNIYKKIMKGSIQEAINYISELELSETQLNQAFYYILSIDASLYKHLISSSLHVEPIELSELYSMNLVNFNSVSKLHEAGANLLIEDSMNKTLVYYAAMHFDIQLLNYLLVEGYPYHYDGYGQDPLHIVLNKIPFIMNDKDVNQILEVLFKFGINIDEHHLSRMSLIRILNKERYEVIIKNYPVLEATDIPLPKVNILEGFMRFIE